MITTGQKIFEVHSTFCNGRACLLFYNKNNFGDLSNGSKETNSFIKELFLNSAIYYLGSSIDLSYQVVWGFFNFIDDESSNNEHNNKLNKLGLIKSDFKNCESDCSYRQLMGLLRKELKNSEISDKKRIIVNEVIDIIDCFNNSNSKFRDIYNYIKHRGSFEFEETYNLFDFPFSFLVNKKDINLTYRVSEKRLLNLLTQTSQNFIEYFSKLIGLIIPDDYLNSEFRLQDLKSAIEEYNKYLNS